MTSTCIRHLTTAFLYVFLLLLSAIPIWYAIHHHTRLNDDTYITLTYAKNLASGRGFVFNHAPPTLGTTSPLFTLVMAGVARLLPQVQLDIISVFFTSLCWIATLYCFYGLRHDWGLEKWHALIFGTVIIAGISVEFLGMEVPLFAFLLTLTFSIYHRHKYIEAGFVSGLLFLTRGEGVLVFVTLLGTTLFVTKDKKHLLKSSLKLTAGFVLPVMIWSLYAWENFGHILPDTLAAKQAQLDSNRWNSFAVRLLQEWLPHWGAQFKIGPINFWWIAVLSGFSYSAFFDQRWGIWLIWIGLYIAGYTLLGVAGYWWYQLPVLFVANLFFALGLTAYSKFPSRRHPFIGQVSILLFIIIIITRMLVPAFRHADSYQGDPRSISYLALADWIRMNTDPKESVAYVEVGYLGYFTPNRIIDLAGLTTPEIIPHVAQGDFVWGFWHFNPDYYVWLSDFDGLLGGIRSDPCFTQAYQPVAELPGPRENNIIVYKRHTQRLSCIPSVQELSPNKEIR